MISDEIYTRAADWWVFYLFRKTDEMLSNLFIEQFKKAFDVRTHFEICMVPNVACCPTEYHCPALLSASIQKMGLRLPCSMVPVRMVGSAQGLIVDVAHARSTLL
jgi:hypothetical protein